METSEIEDVWRDLDRAQLAEITDGGPTPVFASISGAHLYGFASRDSDVDLRGAFLLPARDVLGIAPVDETISLMDDSIIDLDWVAHDLRKFIAMMITHNGYVLEQLYSPLTVVTGPEHEVLKSLGRGCVTRPTVRHYKGFAKGRRKRLSEPKPTVKHILYAFRVLLTGIHMMNTGEVESNLNTLNAEYAEPAIDGLIQRKRNGEEKMALSASDLESHLPILEALDEKLTVAAERSTLPMEPTTVDELEAFLIETRLSTL